MLEAATGAVLSSDFQHGRVVLAVALLESVSFASLHLLGRADAAVPGSMAANCHPQPDHAPQWKERTVGFP